MDLDGAYEKWEDFREELGAQEVLVNLLLFLRNYSHIGPPKIRMLKLKRKFIKNNKLLVW